MKYSLLINLLIQQKSDNRYPALNSYWYPVRSLSGTSLLNNTYPNFRLARLPCEVALGAVGVKLAVEALESVVVTTT